MSKLKHTPGPWTWTVQDYSACTLHGKDQDFNHVMTTSPCNSCIDRIKNASSEEKIWKWGRCTCPKEADARLIASAPEMLEQLIFEYDSMCQGCKFKNTCKVICDHKVKIGMLIEKATGLSIEEVVK